MAAGKARAAAISRRVEDPGAAGVEETAIASVSTGAQWTVAGSASASASRAPLERVRVGVMLITLRIWYFSVLQRNRGAQPNRTPGGMSGSMGELRQGREGLSTAQYWAPKNCDYGSNSEAVVHSEFFG